MARIAIRNTKAESDGRKARKSSTKASTKAVRKGRAKQTTKGSKPVVAEDGKVRLHPDHSRYTKHKDVRTASGRAAYDNSDDVADELRGMELEDVYELVGKAATKAGRDIDLRAKYAHLNLGMQRMNLGNVLRAIRKAAEAKAA